MTSPVKSTCFPADNQTLFLGCSVMSFSVSAGLNGQVSELTVQLVEDNCPAEAGKPKKFRDCLLREQDWTDVDPGFFGELISIIGTPVYFRVGSFEFAGLVQGWERTNDQSSNPVYEVKITDPRILLENTRIIMNDDTGEEPTISGYGIIDNVYNALYWNEKERPGVGRACPPEQQFIEDGAIAGSLAGWYGAADHNRNGLAWDDVIWMIESRINSVNRTDYIKYLSSGGSVTHPTFGTIAGMGLLDENIGFGGYAVDITEIPDVPIYYRFDSTESSLMDMINQVVEDSGCDYYVELVPAPFNETTTCAGYAGSDNRYDLIIKIRCIDRRTQVATTGSIETFVNASVNDGRIISYNEGRELRNDITKSMIIGGQKQSIWQADNGLAPGSIIPYFGTDPNTGDVLIPTTDAKGYWQVTMPTNDLAMQLSSTKYNVTIPAYLLVTEQELIMAQGGFDAWHSWTALGRSALYNALSAYVNTQGVFDLDAINKLFAAINANPLNNARAADFINASKRGFQGHDNMELEILNIAYAWINKIATEYYGKMFQVLVPFTCTKISIEAQAFLNTEEPTDGGWTEASPILGLSNPSAAADFFRRDDDERFLPFVGFNVGAIELSNLSQDSYITDGVRVWIKVNQEQEYVYLDKSIQLGPRMVISLPQQIRKPDGSETVQVAFNALVKLADDFDRGIANGGVDKTQAQAIWNDILKSVGSVDGHEGVLSHAIVPDGAAVAIKSNLLRYGPWAAAGLGTKGGDTNIKVEEGLVPWEYAGYSLMNTAGTELSTAGITKQQVIDKGTVTVHGYPDLPLGAEILSIENGTLAGTQLFETRSPTSRVNLPTRSNAGNLVVNKVTMLSVGDRWTGADGANITTITTRVGPEGTQTTYSMRVFTDKFGRFAQLNARRLKTIGKWRLSLTRYFRAFNRHRLGLLRKQIFNALRPAMIINGRWGAGSRTPHEVIVGQLGIWNDDVYQRPFVADMPIHEVAVEVSENYTEKAFMSLDGLIRPISVKGLNGGHLPKFANPINGCQMTTSKGAQPPIDKVGEAGSFNQYNLDTSINYLNPFANPNTEVPSRGDTPNHGHDIELLGRGSGVPTGSMMMAPGGYLENGNFNQNDYSSDDDYRTFALRGPLILQGWGYDLDGFPIPNKVDSEANAKAGTFQSTNLQHKFMDNFLRKSETWPVAPVDLRFDRERAVWTVPQYRDLVVELKEDMTGGSGLAKRIEGPTLYDSGGTPITEPELYINDKLGCTPLKSGEKAIVRFDPEACEYYIVETCTSGDLCSIDVDDCIPDSKRVLGTCITGEPGIGIRKFAFAKGIRSYTGATDESPTAGTGTEGTCCDLTPDVYLMAGIGLTKWNPAGCAKPTNEINLPFVNDLLVGDGLKIGTTGGSATGCEGVIAAGLEFNTTANACIQTSHSNSFVNKILFGKGLYSNTGSLSNPCEIEIAAGLLIKNDGSGCLTGTSDTTASHTLHFGGGLRSQARTVLQCETDVVAGMNFINSSESGTSTTNVDFANQIYVGKGLAATNTGDCGVLIWSTGTNSSVEYCSNDTCVTQNDTACTGGIEKINFGKGLWKQDSIIDSTLITIGAGFSFSNTEDAPATGNVTFANTIKVGYGLGVATGAACEAIIFSTGTTSEISGCSSDDCITVDDTACTGFNKITFAGGLRKEDFELNHIKVGAGISGGNDTGCLTSNGTVNFFNKLMVYDGLRIADGGSCTAQMAAGISLSNDSSKECIDAANSTFVNKLFFGRGTRVGDTDSNCQASIIAGPQITGEDFCKPSELSLSPLSAGAPPITLTNDIHIGSGLQVASGNPPSGCSSYWAAGMNLNHRDDQCPADWDGGGDLSFTNNFTFIAHQDGYGITGTTGDLDCQAFIAQGELYRNTDTCVKTPMDRKWVNRINVGRGLTLGSGEGDQPCEATIDLNLSVGGIEGQKILFSGGCAPTATLQADGDCSNILLTFGDSGSLTVVTDVVFGECDVILHKVPITFCGTTGALWTGSIAQLTDCSGDLGCPCPTGTG